MNHNEVLSERFLLKILTEDLVTETYLSWFEQKNSLDHIEYSKNKNITLLSLKQYVNEKFNSSECLFFGIYDREKNKHIGNIKFEPIDFKQGYTVLGVLIGAAEWRGRGVFTEIFKALSIELKKIGLKKVYLGVSNHNKAAITAYEKAGFSLDVKNESKTDLSKGFSMVASL